MCSGFQGSMAWMDADFGLNLVRALSMYSDSEYDEDFAPSPCPSQSSSSSASSRTIQITARILLHNVPPPLLHVLHLPLRPFAPFYTITILFFVESAFLEPCGGWWSASSLATWAAADGTPHINYLRRRAEGGLYDLIHYIAFKCVFFDFTPVLS